jgi:hypothetical protein
MRRIILSVSFFVVVLFSNAQDVAVDSKGEPVFQFYSIGSRLEFNRRAPLSASCLFRQNESKKNWGPLIQLSILNSGDLPMIGTLRDVRPGAGIKFGYQHAIKEFFVANQQDKNSRRTSGVHLFFNVDNIKLYDTVTKTAGKKYPLTYGVEGNFSFFLKNKNAHSKWMKALSFYSAISSTWNDHNLLSYQEISKVTLRPDVVAMQDFDGRYGVIKKNFFKSRTAISFPMFYKRLNPVPYVVAIFGTHNSPSYHMGVFTNLLATPVGQSNSKIPSSFGIGFDWVYATENLSSKVNLFLKLSISLDR